MLNFEHIFPYPFKSKAVFAMQEPNVKQEYRIAALVHSRLVADIVYRETLLLGWNISIEVTSYETALGRRPAPVRRGIRSPAVPRRVP